jgi:hypothetical protein
MTTAVASRDIVGDAVACPGARGDLQAAGQFVRAGAQVLAQQG